MSNHNNQQNRPDRSQSPHPKRVPVGARNKLTADQREGFVRRWVNETPGRVGMFEAAGYKVVDDPTKVGDPIAAGATQLGSVVRKPVGGGVDAVLMEIPSEFYREDQEAKEQALKQKEQSLLSEAKEGFYGEGLKVDRQKSSPGVTIE
jgi:hypothetical protein